MYFCVVKVSTLYGPSACGDAGIMYDRARKGWLCRDHTKERLCEFCHAERAWARVWHQYQGIAYYPWLCLSCAGVRAKAATTRPINNPGKI
jgi:hypothetical protein